MRAFNSVSLIDISPRQPPHRFDYMRIRTKPFRIARQRNRTDDARVGVVLRVYVSSIVLPLGSSDAHGEASTPNSAPRRILIMILLSSTIT